MNKNEFMYEMTKRVTEHVFYGMILSMEDEEMSNEDIVVAIESFDFGDVSHQIKRNIKNNELSIGGWIFIGHKKYNDVVSVVESRIKTLKRKALIEYKK